MSSNNSTFYRKSNSIGVPSVPRAYTPVQLLPVIKVVDELLCAINNSTRSLFLDISFGKVPNNNSISKVSAQYIYSGCKMQYKLIKHIDCLL